MRVLFLLAAVAATPALAQDAASILLLVPAETVLAPAEESGPVAARSVTAGERFLLVTSAVGGGFASVWLIGPFAPVGSVAGVYGMGHALGLDASLRSVLGDAAWGAAAGALAGYGAYGYLTLIEGQDADLSVSLGSAAIGLLVGSVTMAMLYDAAPTVLVAPTGEAVPGLALRIGL